MKKNFLKTTGFLAAILLSVTACNKDDIDDLQGDVSTNGDNIETLDELITNGDGIYGSVTGNRGSDSVAFSFDFSHTFMWDHSYNNTYVYDNGDGTYDFYIERYGDVTGDTYSEISITNYAPPGTSSGGASPLKAGVPSTPSANVYAQIQDFVQANDINKTLEFEAEGYSNCCGNTLTVNTLEYNETTKVLNVSVTINSPEDDSDNSTRNPGTITLSFNGPLSWGNTTYRLAKN